MCVRGRGQGLVLSGTWVEEGEGEELLVRVRRIREGGERRGEEPNPLHLGPGHLMFVSCHPEIN